MLCMSVAEYGNLYLSISLVSLPECVSRSLRLCMCGILVLAGYGSVHCMYVSYLGRFSICFAIGKGRVKIQNQYT